MSAKEILFATDARTKIVEGVDIIANAPRDEKTERPNQIVTMKISKK